MRLLSHAQLAALAIVAASPADAHCYSRWYYPTPQHCGGHGVRARAAAYHPPDRSWSVEIVAPPVKDWPLPSLEWTPADAPLDDESLARLKLRGIMNQ